jgi:hypothetical protein
MRYATKGYLIDTTLTIYNDHVTFIFTFNKSVKDNGFYVILEGRVKYVCEKMECEAG